MSSLEERRMILQMLQEGKISAEEAEKLLEAIENREEEPAQEARQTHTGRGRQKDEFNEEIMKMRDRINSFSKDMKSRYQSGDFERSVDEFASKAEKVGKDVAQTTFGVIDRMIDFVGSVVENGSFNFFGAYPVVEKTFEAPVVEGDKLEVEARNGQITLKKHDQPTVFVRARIRSNIQDAEGVVAFEAAGGIVRIRPVVQGNISVQYDIYAPEQMLSVIRLVTTNAKIYYEDVRADDIECVTKNAAIEVMGTLARRVRLQTKNARVQVSYTTASEIFMETSNAAADIKHVRVGKMGVTTSNARISLENIGHTDDNGDSEIILHTSNGGIRVNFGDVETRGYRVRARTSNSSINLLVPELAYQNVQRSGSRSEVDAMSPEYSSYAQRVSLMAETSNGHIEVVK